MTTSADQLVIFTRDELDLIAEFAAGCTLDEKPGSNWVQDAGGLPEYICRIARAIKRSGKTTSQAISIAVSRVKKWATGVGVNNDTQVKAAAAVAEWEKLKVKAHAKTGAKKAAGVLAATYTSRHDVLLLTDYNVDIVQQAFNDRTRQVRADWRNANPNASYDDGPPYLWVKEQWTSFLIVQSDYGKNPTLYKVPYTVDDDLNVEFDTPVEVQTQYIVVDSGDLTGADLTDEDLQKLLELTPPCGQSKVDKFLTLSPTRTSALDRVLALAVKVKDTTDDDADTEDMSDDDMMAAGKKMMARGKAMMDKADTMSGDAADAMTAAGKKMMARGKAMMAKGGGDSKTGSTAMMSALDKILALAADSKMPYGDVTYADTGFQSDGKKRYPIDTEVHVRAAWSYVNQADNAAKYSSKDLATVKNRIKAAAKKLGINIADS